MSQPSQFFFVKTLNRRLGGMPPWSPSGYAPVHFNTYLLRNRTRSTRRKCKAVIIIIGITVICIINSSSSVCDPPASRLVTVYLSAMSRAARSALSFINHFFSQLRPSAVLRGQRRRYFFRSELNKYIRLFR